MCPLRASLRAVLGVFVSTGGWKVGFGGVCSGTSELCAVLWCGRCHGCDFAVFGGNVGWLWLWSALFGVRSHLL